MQGTYVACVSVVLQQGNQLTVTNWFALHMFRMFRMWFARV